ncbi:MAG: M23 family metallopeptidase [Actinomycetota bacterium]
MSQRFKNATLALVAVASVVTVPTVSPRLNIPFFGESSTSAQTFSCDNTVRRGPQDSFTFKVKSTNGIRVRSSPITTAAGNGQSLNYNQNYTALGWRYGETVTDLSNPNLKDALWFLVNVGGVEGWVPSAWTIGYPPGNPPIQPNCNNSGTPTNNQPALFPNPTSSNPLRGFQHPFNGSGPRPTGHPGDRIQLYADDIGASIGTPIYAMRSGRVIAITQDVQDLPPNQNNQFTPYPFIVNYIVIEHDQDVRNQSGNYYRSLYMHIKQNSAQVRVGDRVQAGQRIAATGHNGASSGPHLHVDVNYPTGSDPLRNRQTVPYVWNPPYDYNK